jgi:hypothetical protein
VTFSEEFSAVITAEYLQESLLRIYSPFWQQIPQETFMRIP